MNLDPLQDHTQPGDTLFRDVLSLALLGFMAVIVLLLPHIKPEGKVTDAKTPTPGHVVIEITWPGDMDADVDLWVKAPDDIPVGYSNKGGAIFNLLRDDLGKTLDLSSINHESAYSRGVAPGEYVVNAHLYRVDRHRPPPFRVEAVVSVKHHDADGAPVLRPALFTSAKLKFQGQEVTLARFRLNADGTLVKGSVNSLYMGLRSKAAK